MCASYQSEIQPQTSMHFAVCKLLWLVRFSVAFPVWLNGRRCRNSTIAPKIVLHSTAGYRPELDELVAAWISRGVRYVGVFGVDSSRLDDIIDELCVGEGSQPYAMLTACHGPGESLQDALELASQMSEEFGSGIEVVEF